MKKPLLLTFLLLFVGQDSVFAAMDITSMPGIHFDMGGSEDVEGTALSIQLILLLTILSVAPSILLLMTSFTRIAIVLSFVRTALGTQ